MKHGQNGYNPRLDPQPNPKRFTNLDGCETNAINFDNPLFTLGRGRREAELHFGRGGKVTTTERICPPSQCKPQAGSGIFRALDKPRGGGRQ